MLRCSGADELPRHDLQAHPVDEICVGLGSLLVVHVPPVCDLGIDAVFVH